MEANNRPNIIPGRTNKFHKIIIIHYAKILPKQTPHADTSNINIVEVGKINKISEY